MDAVLTKRVVGLFDNHPVSDADREFVITAVNHHVVEPLFDRLGDIMNSGASNKAQQIISAFGQYMPWINGDKLQRVAEILAAA